jgi:hypothetical protein
MSDINAFQRLQLIDHALLLQIKDYDTAGSSSAKPYRLGENGNQRDSRCLLSSRLLLLAAP